MRVYKDLLGVQKQTTNDGVLLELGEIPLSILAQCYCIKNYSRIYINKKANSILLAMAEFCYGNNSWSSVTEAALNRTGIGKCDTEIRRHLLSRLKDIFHQETFAKINTDHSKLRTYGEFKTVSGLEPYLVYPMKIQYRTTFSKFRLSNHALQIEKGRHSNIAKNQRFCPFCPTFVETEQHFLLQCRKYAIGREKLFRELTVVIPGLSQKLEKEKFIELMTNSACLPKTAEFISLSFDIREFLLQKHQNNQ